MLPLSKKKKIWLLQGFQFSDLSNGVVNLQTFDASQFTLDGSNNVGNWIDLFGNGNDFQQTTAIDRPDGANILTDGILFNGGNEFLESDANIANFTSFSAFTYFSVIKRTTATQQMHGLTFADSAVDNKLINMCRVLNSDFGVADARNDLGSQFSNVATGDIIYGDIATVNNVYALAVLTSNGSRWRLRLNGVELGITVQAGANSGKYADDIASLDRVTLGAVMRSSAFFGEGGLKSIVLYSGEKTNAEIGSVETLLRGTYSIVF